MRVTSEEARFQCQPKAVRVTIIARKYRCNNAAVRVTAKPFTGPLAFKNKMAAVIKVVHLRRR